MRQREGGCGDAGRAKRSRGRGNPSPERMEAARTMRLSDGVDHHQDQSASDDAVDGGLGQYEWIERGGFDPDNLDAVYDDMREIVARGSETPDSLLPFILSLAGIDGGELAAQAPRDERFPRLSSHYPCALNNVMLFASTFGTVRLMEETTALFECTLRQLGTFLTILNLYCDAACVSADMRNGTGPGAADAEVQPTTVQNLMKAFRIIASRVGACKGPRGEVLQPVRFRNQFCFAYRLYQYNTNGNMEACCRRWVNMMVNKFHSHHRFAVGLLEDLKLEKVNGDNALIAQAARWIESVQDDTIPCATVANELVSITSSLAKIR